MKESNKNRKKVKMTEVQKDDITIYNWHRIAVFLTFFVIAAVIIA